jgi:hypothetical protein
VKSLEQFAMEWLRYERRCVTALCGSRRVSISIPQQSSSLLLFETLFRGDVAGRSFCALDMTRSIYSFIGLELALAGTS